MGGANSVVAEEWGVVPSSSSDSPPQHSGRVRWIVDVRPLLACESDAHAAFQFLLRLVPDAREREAVTKFRFLADKSRALVSRLLARRCAAMVCDLPFAEVQLGRTKGLKPFVSSAVAESLPFPNFNFNISHEGNFVVLAAEPVCVVGVDVAAPSQFRRPGKAQRDVDEFFRDMQDSLGAAEWAVVQNETTDEGKLAAFRRFWSCKEAFIKARGDGLAFEPLSRCVFTLTDCDEGFDATVQVVTVARAPLTDVVDAHGAFTATLSKKQSDFSAEEWRRELCAAHPVFETLELRELVPLPLRDEFLALLPATSSE